LDYTLYRIVPVYLLQAYKHTSVDAPYTYISCDWTIELVFEPQMTGKRYGPHSFRVAAPFV